MTSGVLTMSSKGQITIPASLREKFDFHPKHKIRYTVEGDSINLQRDMTLDEAAEYFTSLIKPGVKPITNLNEWFEENYHGQRF